MADKNQNFRITTDYVLELYCVDDGLFHKIWIEQDRDGNPTLGIAKEADTESEAIEDWDFTKNQFPTPPESAKNTTNYNVDYSQIIRILNTTTGLWHVVSVGGDLDNPTFEIAKNGDNI